MGGAPVNAHFDREPLDALGVAGTAPQVRVMAEDVPQVAAGTAVVAGGQSYVVRNIRPLNAGAELLLILQKV